MINVADRSCSDRIYGCVNAAADANVRLADQADGGVVTTISNQEVVVACDDIDIARTIGQEIKWTMPACHSLLVRLERLHAPTMRQREVLRC